jgi:hypothetical protein
MIYKSTPIKTDSGYYGHIDVNIKGEKPHKTFCIEIIQSKTVEGNKTLRYYKINVCIKEGSILNYNNTCTDKVTIGCYEYVTLGRFIKFMDDTERDYLITYLNRFNEVNNLNIELDYE